MTLCLMVRSTQQQLAPGVTRGHPEPGARVQEALMTRWPPQAREWKTWQSQGLGPEKARAVNPRPGPRQGQRASVLALVSSSWRLTVPG